MIFPRDPRKISRGKITQFWNITIYFHRFSKDFLGFPVSHRFSIDFSYFPINFHRFSYSFPLKIHLKTSRHLAPTAAPSSAPHGLGRRTFLSTGKYGGEDVAENGWTTTSYVWVIWVISTIPISPLKGVWCGYTLNMDDMRRSLRCLDPRMGPPLDSVQLPKSGCLDWVWLKNLWFMVDITN